MDPLHVPAWAWAVTIAAVGGLIAADLLASYRRTRPVRMAEAAWWTLAAIALAVAFGALLAVASGGTAAGQFFAGWLTEYSLSLDNLLVFVILVGRSKLPLQRQSRVVLAGILLALLFRGVVIAVGAAALHRFAWVEYLFGAFLVYTAVQVVGQRRLGDGTGAPSAFGRRRPAEHPAPAGSPGQAGPAADGGQPAALRGGGARLAARLGRTGRVTPVVMLVIALGVTDVLFAFDSIPAIFGLTKDPFLVFSANLFALLGLRHLYFLAGGLLNRLMYLPAGLAVVLTFIGLKLIAEALRADGVTRLGPVPVPGVSAWLSLVIIIAVLAVTAVASVTATPAAKQAVQPRGPDGGGTRRALARSLRQLRWRLEDRAGRPRCRP